MDEDQNPGNQDYEIFLQFKFTAGAARDGCGRAEAGSVRRGSLIVNANIHNA
jgi:hypothetical protein